MNERRFYITDVFAEERYAGNQLAVVRNAAGLSDSEMLEITKEMNYSETTFILSDEEHDGGYDVRIFTPATELPFAGHPTLGTAYIIQREVIGQQVGTVILNLKVGQIPVSFSYHDGGEADILWMRQIEPSFGKTVDAHAIARVLNLEVSDVDTRFPIQEVSTGTPALIVPLRTLDATRRARVAREECFQLIETLEAKGILVFCPETYHPENQLNVRFFADYYGVPEDPATGSANGCLAGYLVKHRYFGTDSIDVRVEQGYEMGRPSLLFLRAGDVGGTIEVNVGGRVVPVARGELV